MQQKYKKQSPILQVDKYTYSVCPFKDAFQKEGSSRTSLGTWAGLADDSTVMKFTGGQACWQGPARSMTVRPALPHVQCCITLCCLVLFALWPVPW